MAFLDPTSLIPKSIGQVLGEKTNLVFYVPARLLIYQLNRRRSSKQPPLTSLENLKLFVQPFLLGDSVLFLHMLSNSAN